MKIALGQINTTVGDFSGNAARMIDFAHRARGAGAGLIIFPELAICGYPPRDLVERPAFVQKNLETAEHIARETRGIAVITGMVTPAHANTGKAVLNSAILLQDGKIAFTQSKMLLPTYDVFDELRNFAPAAKQELLPFCGRQMALTICEDAWNDKNFWSRPLYPVDPVEELIRLGGNCVLNISASPFYVGKIDLRRRMLRAIAQRHRVPVAIANVVGGNDSIVFDGSSMVIAPDGQVIAQARAFEEDIVYFDPATLTGEIHEIDESPDASAYRAIVLGTRDYVHKCGFRSGVIGLSGGIDSALVAAIAVEALGKENVIGVGMPSPISSQGSIHDARALAANLGIRFELVPISDIYGSYRSALSGVFSGMAEDVTEENIQARIRGNLLMAFSNKLGAMVLSTGNKSELAVGYCTLYGDMAGGLAVISDVPKTMVYRLAAYVNREREIIPQATIDKPPSAELRPGQKDTDTLPPYEVLDAILEDHVEDNQSPAEIARERGFDLALIQRVVEMIERNEYKRQQAAPGIKISEKAFGVGRRIPIAKKNQI